VTRGFALGPRKCWRETSITDISLVENGREGEKPLSLARQSSWKTYNRSRSEHNRRYRLRHPVRGSLERVSVFAPPFALLGVLLLGLLIPQGWSPYGFWSGAIVGASLVLPASLLILGIFQWREVRFSHPLRAGIGFTPLPIWSVAAFTCINDLASGTDPQLCDLTVDLMWFTPVWMITWLFGPTLLGFWSFNRREQRKV